MKLPFSIRSAFCLLTFCFLFSGCASSLEQTSPAPSNTYSPDPTVTATVTNTPSPAPTLTPTLVPDADADQDGLTNLAEMVKYKTDPHQSDTDGDGVPDGDWEERRNYVYSVHVLMKIRPPFDIEAMNDLFQDIRLVSEEDDNGYSTLDIIIYPDTKIPLAPSPYPLTGLSDELIEFTQPGISTNYSPEMQAQVLDMVEYVNTDVEAIEKILYWIDNETALADMKDIPPVFYYTYIKDDEVRFRNPPNLPESLMLENLFYADSMFKNRVHGTCCSTATLKCAMIKSAGIPCKVTQSLMPIYAHENQPEAYENKLHRKWNNSYENLSESLWLNHCFLEAYLGNQWVRVDNTINIYNQTPANLSLKTLSVADLSEVDFSKTYPTHWIYNRPYYTLLVEDRYPVNE